MSREINYVLDEASLNKHHWKIWFLSAMGVFIDAFDLFIIAAALPLIAHYFHASALEIGMIGAASLLGCVLGASTFGRLTDKLGRKAIFMIDIVFFVIFALCSASAWSIGSLMVFRFLLGIGIGADYPVSSTYVAENMPKRIRGRMTVGSFGFQAIGAVAGATVGLMLLYFSAPAEAWRWMLGIGAVPAIIVILLRAKLPESPRWLANKGELEKASKAATLLAGRTVFYQASEKKEASFKELFSRKYIKRTLACSLTWFFMDIAFYGIGIFTPMILAAMALSEKGNFIAHDISHTEHSTLFKIFLVIGILIAIILIEKWGRIRLQATGFIGMTIGLFILVISSAFSGQLHMIFLFGGFIMFNVCANMGPNPITFMLPTELFHTPLRATAQGFSAACGKVGATLSVLFIPLLISHIGLSLTLSLIAVGCFLGFVLTLTVGMETAGQSLDNIEHNMHVQQNLNY